MQDEKLNKIKGKEQISRFDNTYSEIRKIIETTDVGTWKWNVQTGEMVFSDKWEKIIGYNLNEFGVINIKILESITHPDDFNKSKELLKKHFERELPYYKHESRIKHKDGHYVWICARGCVATRTADGKPLIMFGTHTDITKRKETEQALDNYINTLNHDLRSPMSVIIGYSSYLLEEELSKDEIKKYSQIIKNTGERMLKMMESYLSLAKIERGQDISGKSIKMVTDIVDEIKRNYSDLKNSKKLKITFRDLENISHKINLDQKSILIDEILFYSIINNLLNNAIEASFHADDEMIINVYEEGGLCLNFFNTGEITKEIQKKLFKKFISSKKNGTGMGLYSARLISRAHGGDITYQSVPGGTRFLLKIPFN